jgi:hypothetical protein
MGDTVAARASWTSALRQLPVKTAENPDQMAIHATILRRLGRDAEAQSIAGKLNRIGYRQVS